MLSLEASMANLAVAVVQQTLSDARRGNRQARAWLTEPGHPDRRIWVAWFLNSDPERWADVFRRELDGHTR